MYKQTRKLLSLQRVYRRCCRYFSISSPRPVRVRFAPSPTGELHLGGLRTALYNYMFAKSHDGKFVLRIEDTDQNRLVPGAMEKIESILDWAGVQIDEGPRQGGSFGPYIQSERKWLYWEMIQPLLQNGSAYHCFCSPKRLHLLKKEAMRQGEIPKYDNRCRFLKQKEVDDRLRDGTPYTIRLRLEPCTDPWHDLVYGPIMCDIANIEGDPILIKSDRYPTYHFANVVDDHLMHISHVLRGVEWQVSTAKHLLMYEAFGWNPPQFGHLPLLMNKDGKKLSKRQNEAVIEHYKAEGFLPEAVLSMVTASGGGFNVKEHSHMHLDELTKHFELSTMNTNSTRVDFDVVLNYNKLHLKLLMNSPLRKDVIGEVQCLIQKRFYAFIPFPEDILTEIYVGRALDWALDRVNLLKDLIRPEFEFLWQVPSLLNIDQLLKAHANLSDNLQMVYDNIELYSEEEFSQETLGLNLKHMASTKALRYGQLMKQLRGALSGLEVGPSVAEIMCVLGKQQTLLRLKKVLEELGNS